MMNKMMTMNQKAGHRVGLYGKVIDSTAIRVIKTRESPAERRARWKAEDLHGIRRLEATGLTESNCSALKLMKQNYRRKYREPV
ncbi:MAG: hypothetical protein E5Y10_24955 [Mesorhizobium sp.]|uniref:hypothetical protein n=1 Tax=Mesorhizobium sp. TaxID=1871066 RepID=UPI0012115A63|nr:hypothetical protein [Mesorhizobium sp.]TIN38834.1 MAG: hypothetical protein E5Y13_15380 [Mesorhizobium sp.]TJU85672.1 MAG: hypothetical protein E5Y10_24955 [Mesorhizobium sp.]